MRRNAGFTLIEILVVIAIIAAILGGVSIMIRKASGVQQTLKATNRVNGLGAAIDMLHAPDNLGMYPPSRMDQLIGPGATGPVGKKLGTPPNDVNCGIESVYVAVRLKGVKADVSGFESDDSIANLDDDRATAMVPDMMSGDLFEYIDPWGNPLVYISSRDYKDPKKVERYVLGDKQEVKVAPAKRPNGEFVRPDSFQLFSMGPDGVPGTDDDIQYGSN
ncbi:MAG: type II secretion system GspH family protein [Planctomycetes bacterium]|nr:type II secretion system GspH family protein [Planctomycetota bacterium]